MNAPTESLSCLDANPDDKVEMEMVGNYYGAPYVGLRDGRPVFGLEDYSGASEVLITEEEYAVLRALFARYDERA